jgi:hypothetical protein
VLPPTEDGKLAAHALNDTNKLELRVFANETYRHAVLVARLDNLGKGASGAAVQNLQPDAGALIAIVLIADWRLIIKRHAAKNTKNSSSTPRTTRRTHVGGKSTCQQKAHLAGAARSVGRGRAKLALPHTRARSSSVAAQAFQGRIHRGGIQPLGLQLLAQTLRAQAGSAAVHQRFGGALVAEKALGLQGIEQGVRAALGCTRAAPACAAAPSA